MKQQKQTGFRCYICGRTFPDQTRRATPCAYEHFDRAVCVDCCERCYQSEPFPCEQYNRRKRRERRKQDQKGERKGGGV